MSSTTLVTTTRDRPVCVKLLERWIGQQTVKPDRWLIVDDGDAPCAPTMGQDHVRVTDDPGRDGVQSLMNNWRVALDRIDSDFTIVAEDDDWFHPDYVKVMRGLLQAAELVGVIRDVTFHPKELRSFRHDNSAACSLSCTGWRRSLAPFVRRCLDRGTVVVDTVIWGDHRGSRRTVDNVAADGRLLHVMMDKMPGRTNLLKDSAPLHPSSMAELVKWIGASDAAAVLEAVR